jgi:hypothetical protein
MGFQFPLAIGVITVDLGWPRESKWGPEPRALNPCLNQLQTILTAQVSSGTSTLYLMSCREGNQVVTDHVVSRVEINNACALIPAARRGTSRGWEHSQLAPHSRSDNQPDFKAGLVTNRAGSRFQDIIPTFSKSPACR